MGFLYLVEQQHTVRSLANSVGKQSTVFVAHIAGRRPDKFSYRMLFSIFAHVEP